MRHVYYDTYVFYKSRAFIWYVTCPYDGNNGFFTQHSPEIHKIALLSIGLGSHLGYHGKGHILWQNMFLKWICHDWDSQNSFLEHSNYPKNKKFEKGLIYEWRPSWIAYFHLLHLVQDVCWIQIQMLMVSIARKMQLKAGSRVVCIPRAYIKKFELWFSRF